MSNRVLYLRFFVSGALSAMLYCLLYFYEKEIMASFARSDGFYPVLPVLAALVFSLVHGAFAGYFWEVLGVTARSGK